MQQSGRNIRNKHFRWFLRETRASEREMKEI